MLTTPHTAPGATPATSSTRVLLPGNEPARGLNNDLSVRAQLVAAAVIIAVLGLLVVGVVHGASAVIASVRPLL